VTPTRRKPIRSPEGGQNLSIWLNSTTQATLRTLAQRTGLPLRTIARKLIEHSLKETTV